MCFTIRGRTICMPSITGLKGYRIPNKFIVKPIRGPEGHPTPLHFRGNCGGKGFTMGIHMSWRSFTSKIGAIRGFSPNMPPTYNYGQQFKEHTRNVANNIELITREDLDRGLKMLNANTAVGICQWSPLQLRYLSDRSKDLPEKSSFGILRTVSHGQDMITIIV